MLGKAILLGLLFINGAGGAGGSGAAKKLDVPPFVPVERTARKCLQYIGCLCLLYVYVEGFKVYNMFVSESDCFLM